MQQMHSGYRPALTHRMCEGQDAGMVQTRHLSLSVFLFTQELRCLCTQDRDAGSSGVTTCSGKCGQAAVPFARAMKGEFQILHAFDCS